MTRNTSPATRIRNGLIALAAVSLAICFFLANSYRNHTVSLANLAQRSVPLEIAQQNQKPTLLEFYADWCTSCQSMAPVIAEMETEFQDRLNVVMLNVDNSRWLPELNHYQVNGIPHFVFLDPSGQALSHAVGEQPPSILHESLIALVSGSTVAEAKVGQTSDLSPAPERIRQPQPLTHG